MEAQENISLRAKMSSSVEETGFVDRMKKRKDKGKDTRSKGKEKDKEGDIKERGREGKDMDTHSRRRHPVARPACSFCHIPYSSRRKRG